MDFRFDDEQLALRDAVKGLCNDHADLGVNPAASIRSHCRA